MVERTATYLSCEKETTERENLSPKSRINATVFSDFIFSSKPHATYLIKMNKKPLPTALINGKSFSRQKVSLRFPLFWQSLPQGGSISNHCLNKMQPLEGFVYPPSLPHWGTGVPAEKSHATQSTIQTPRKYKNRLFIQGNRTYKSLYS